MSINLNNKEVLEALAMEFGDSDADQPEAHHLIYKKGWRPKLNVIQGLAVADKAIFKLFAGERYSGKTVGALHELMDYCYRNDNTLGYIIVKEVGIGTEGGAWDKLLNLILPEWQSGLGIQCTESRLDIQTKKPYVWITNRHGGWSKIMLASLPVAGQVEGKIRGREPQIIMVDEAQFLESDVYFTALIMQLGRRNKKGGDPSKIIFCCNPEGPSHWLYQRFFVMPVDEETGEWDNNYAHYHIPISDNILNLPAGYYENYIQPAVKNDPIAEARLIRGEWVDRPDGESLFGRVFVELIHIRGDAIKGSGLLPVTPHPIIVSYDPGAAHTCVYFEQVIPTLDKIFKLVIDEFDFVGQYMPYIDLVPLITKRMQYWEQKMGYEFQWIHISDDSAFNQYRAATGSFDAWDIEKISKDEVARYNLAKRFIIKIRACPKGEHSIEARVRMVTDDLITQSLLVSAACPRLKEMLMRLPTDKENRLKPRAKHRYGHNLAAMSYGFFYFNTTRLGVPIKTDQIEPKSYAICA